MKGHLFAFEVKGLSFLLLCSKYINKKSIMSDFNGDSEMRLVIG